MPSICRPTQRLSALSIVFLATTWSHGAAALDTKLEDASTQLPDYEVRGESLMDAPKRNLERLEKTLPKLGEGAIEDDDGVDVLEALGLKGEGIQGRPEQEQKRAVQLLEKMQDPDPQ